MSSVLCKRSSSVASTEKGHEVAEGPELRFQRISGCVVCRPAGEIDLAQSTRFREELCNLVETTHVVIDLSDVTFIDSTGLGAMVAASNRARAAGTSIHLAGAWGEVRKVLELTELDAHLGHHDNVAEAVDAAVVAQDASV